LSAGKGQWISVAVALVTIASARLLRPPLELMEPNRLLIGTLAAIAILAVVLPCVYVFIRYPQRRYWTRWAGLSLATIVALAAALVHYQNLRSTYSVYVDGISVVVGANDELTTLGRLHFEQFGEPPKAMVEKIGQPAVLWEPAALRRHARQLERNYYLCEALIALLGMSVIGVWRARRTASDAAGTTSMEPRRRISTGQATQKRFQVALSYPGEVRDRVSGIASILERTLARDAIFYDKWYAGELARPNLDLHLQDIYKRDSELLVIVLCAEYEAKDWCGLEWRVVRDLIKHREADRIMLLRLDDAPISGLLSIDGYLDIATLSDEQVANLILSRVAT
jgi:general stress protein CsbA